MRGLRRRLGSPGALIRDRRGRIRSGWRVAAWFAAVWVALVAASVAGVRTFPRAASTAVYAGLVAAVSLLAWRVFDGWPPRRTWVWPDGSTVRELGVGILAGVALVGIALLPVLATGDYRVLPLACRLEDQATFLLRTGIVLLAAAAFEELLFRGYPLYAFASGPGRVVAVVLTSAVFALLHAPNPHFGARAGVILFGIGVVLAVSVLQRRSVAEALGAHLGWNAALAMGVAVPVSGLALPSRCHVGVLSGPEWWTGGGFGLEAGVPAMAAWVLAAAALWLRGRRSGGDPG